VVQMKLTRNAIDNPPRSFRPHSQR